MLPPRPASTSTLGGRRLPRLGEVPFDSAPSSWPRSTRDGDDVGAAASKGAPDVLLGRCTAVVDGDGAPTAVDDATRVDRLAENDRLAVAGPPRAGRGHAPAPGRPRSSSTPTAPSPTPTAGSRTSPSTALVGIVDPPRAEARDAIAPVPPGRHRGEDDHRRPRRHGRRHRRRARHRGPRSSPAPTSTRIDDDELAAAIDGDRRVRPGVARAQGAGRARRSRPTATSWP